MGTDITRIVTAVNAKESKLGGASATTDAQKRNLYLAWETDGNVSKPGKVGLLDQKDIVATVQVNTPSDNTAAAPAAATFRVVANSIPTSTLVYKWCWSNGLPLVANSLMTGVTASNLVISDSTSLNGKRFYCNVTMLLFGGSAQTAIANLTVT